MEKETKKKKVSAMSPQEKARLAEKLRFEMMAASKRLDFETAAVLRDKLRALQETK